MKLFAGEAPWSERVHVACQPLKGCRLVGPRATRKVCRSWLECGSSAASPLRPEQGYRFRRRTLRVEAHDKTMLGEEACNGIGSGSSIQRSAGCVHLDNSAEEQGPGPALWLVVGVPNSGRCTKVARRCGAVHHWKLTLDYFLNGLLSLAAVRTPSDQPGCSSISSKSPTRIRLALGLRRPVNHPRSGSISSES